MPRPVAKTNLLFFIQRLKDKLYYAGPWDSGEQEKEEELFTTDITQSHLFASRDEAKKKIAALQKRRWYRLFRKDKFVILISKQIRR